MVVCIYLFKCLFLVMLRVHVGSGLAKPDFSNMLDPFDTPSFNKLYRGKRSRMSIFGVGMLKICPLRRRGGCHRGILEGHCCAVVFALPACSHPRSEGACLEYHLGAPPSRKALQVSVLE